MGDVGVKMLNSGDASGALAVLEKSTKFSGTGVKRYRDKPRLQSDEEKQALQFNIACCYSALAAKEKGVNEDKERELGTKGLAALQESIKEGYDNWDQIMTDPDLQALREDPRDPGFVKLREFYEPEASGFGKYFGPDAIDRSAIGRFLKSPQDTAIGRFLSLGGRE